jgi:hypothetical protein
MAQLSRPFQVALVGVAVLAAVWVVALRGHSGAPNATPAAPVSVNTTTSPTAQVKTPGSAKSSSKKSGGSSSHVYHGAAPGVEGLTKAVAKAHGAVSTSEANASQLQQKSEQASSASPSSAVPNSSAASSPSSAPSTTASTPAASTPSTSATSTTASTPKSSASSGATTGIPARERAVEAALHKGQVAVILFWDAQGSDDQAVHKALNSLKSQHALHIFISDASASQASDYGSITTGIQIYGTPTLLVLNSKGTTITLTGLQDAYTIRQAVEEAQHSRAF